MCSNFVLKSRVYNMKSKEFLEGLILKNDWDKIIQILNLGVADINYRDCRGRNILYYAIANKKYEYIKPLIDLGINLKVNFHLSALNFAVCLDDVRAIEALIKSGFDINDVDELGCSALIYSILYNKKRSMECLLAHKADTQIEDFMGNCAKNLLEKRK